MTAYNFKQQFAEAVESGAKRQTLRRPRRRPTQPGDRLRLYTEQLTKGRRGRREVTCTQVLPIHLDRDSVWASGMRLSETALTWLALADGFESGEQLLAFFDRLYGLPVDLELITWEAD
jgi:hypothetical protein